ncbi:hypothetical protein VIBNIFTn2_120017 [Vibrio nigripulchritudo FTn2]|nr:hypothetical protein VIBNIFTn2_120017 [Vibrio nigripulchritudo FTn2]
MAIRSTQVKTRIKVKDEMGRVGYLINIEEEREFPFLLNTSPKNDGETWYTDAIFACK